MPPVPYCYTSTWHYTRAELDEYKHELCKKACHTVTDHQIVQTTVVNDQSFKQLTANKNMADLAKRTPPWTDR